MRLRHKRRALLEQLSACAGVAVHHRTPKPITKTTMRQDDFMIPSPQIFLSLNRVAATIGLEKSGLRVARALLCSPRSYV